MARGRHVKRSGLLARLWPRRRRVAVLAAQHAPVPDRYAALDGELSRLRVLGIAHAAAAASADVRARRAEAQLGAVRDELSHSRVELAALRAELAGVRADVVAVREDLVWAFAEGAVTAAPVTGVVVDLRDGTARSA